MQVELIAVAVLAVVVAGVILWRKKQDDKKKEGPARPTASFLDFVEARPAGFPSAIQYAAWAEKYDFPRSKGEPTPADVSMETLDAAHADVMSRMTYVADGGPDYTSPVWGDDGRGDCEDFALAFRQAAMDRGVPVTAMRLCHLQTADGFWHGVCLVWVNGVGIISLDQRLARPWPLTAPGTYILDKAGVEAGDAWLYFYGQGG